MPNVVIDKCPHCSTSHVQTDHRFGEVLDATKGGAFWQVLRCQNPACRKLVLITAMGNPGGKIIESYPVGTFELEADIPVSQETRDDFREAGLSLGAGCFKASMVMSRRALQRCLKEQGCSQHNLVDAINHAIASNILRKSFHPLAEEVRQYGNLGAHPDDDQLANANGDNAHVVLEFVRLLIHEFYEVPAAAAKLKHSRTK